MLPIVLDPTAAKVGLAGAGESLARREAMLLAAGVSLVRITEDEALPADLKLLFLAGLDRAATEARAKQARAAGILVNAEDRPELCDFHVPAIVRRGELMLTASTGGRSPGLARRVREWLDAQFGPEWDDRLEDLDAARKDWRASGLAPNEVSRRTRALIAQKGWL